MTPLFFGFGQSPGEGFRLLCMYKCDEAVRALRRLPDCQFNTGWAQMCLGRAFTEQAAYADAHSAYDAARIIAPSLLEGIEYFSSVLWQRKRDVPLAYLAQEALALDRHSPQAWCASGNSLSLSRDHEGALRCFKRAIALDPDLAYAHALCGHEHLANDDFESAQGAFRAALRIDARHYNAWYGIGMVYQKQEKFELAVRAQQRGILHGCNNRWVCVGALVGSYSYIQSDPNHRLVAQVYHFKRALAINTRSSVLRCCLARAPCASLFLSPAPLSPPRAVLLRRPLRVLERPELLSVESTRWELDWLEQLRGFASEVQRAKKKKRTTNSLTIFRCRGSRSEP